jgi:hypothetical protein
MNNDYASTGATSQGNVSPDDVSRRAYELWEQEGRPEGRELEHWLRAEGELRSRRTGESAVTSGNFTGERNVAADSRARGSNGAASSRRGATSAGSARPFAAEKPAAATESGRGQGQRRRLEG